MKQWVMAFFCCVAPLVLADGHGELGLEKRQPDAPMTVTSVTLGQETTAISAQGDMEGYGKVYVTYHLSYNADRNGGTVARWTGKVVDLPKRASPLGDFKVSGS